MLTVNRAIWLYTGGIFILGVIMTASTTTAATISAAVGGVPNNATIYENFDSLTEKGGTTANGITVIFSGNASVAALPNVAGIYASPYISNGNSILFDNFQSYGQNKTQYLTTGTGSVTLELGGYHQYFGLLWGSVDSYNTLSFYDDDSFLFEFTGSDVNVLADGNQGAAGTFYVNINSDIAFNKVIITSSHYAFEFDNVALAEQPLEFPAEVPTPGTLLLLGIGLLMSWIVRQFAR